MNKDRLQVELLDRVQSSIEKQIFSYEVEEIEELMPESKSDRSIFKPFKGHFGHSRDSKF